MITSKEIDIIYKLNPSIVTIRGDEAFDAEGNKIEYSMQEVQAYINANSYIEKRAKEYPPITDYLDGIVKNDQKQIQAYIDACLVVKAKYPKGELA